MNATAPSTNIDPRITITYTYKNIQEPTKEGVERIVIENVQGKMSSYFKKVLTHDDATILIRVVVEKNKKELFNGKFTFELDGGEPYIYETEDFENLDDLINHAFKHLKQQLADA